MRFVSHTGYLAHENSMSEIRETSMHKNNSKSEVKNMSEELEYEEEKFQIGLTRDKVLTLILTGGCGFPYQ